MITLTEIYNYLTRITNFNLVEQGVFLVITSLISIVLYLNKLKSGKVTSKQWEIFLLTTLLFIIIPESFYTYVWELIFN